MPAWKLHLHIASKISNYINLDKTEFLIGNLLPNYCCGEIIKNLPTQIEHDKSHFYKNDKPDLKMFYYIYQNQIRRKPLILGYFVHLIVDDFFNQKFEEKLVYGTTNLAGVRIGNTFSVCTLRKAKKLKRFDFIYYDEKLTNYLEELSFKQTIVPQLKLMKEINVTEEEIVNLIDYVNSKPRRKAFRCLLFPEKEIDKLINECVDYVINYLKMEIRMLL